MKRGKSMITAKEASKLYNGTLILRDKYISKVIEPLIKKEAIMYKEIKIPVIDRYACGPMIDFYNLEDSEKLSYAEQIELTEEIIKTLIENGYKTHISCGAGTQFADTSGNMIISWN
jgi:hypothetical protein